MLALIHKFKEALQSIRSRTIQLLSSYWCIYSYTCGSTIAFIVLTASEYRLRSIRAKLRLLCRPLLLLLRSSTAPQWSSSRLLARPRLARRAALRARPPSRRVCRASRSRLRRRARRSSSQRRLRLARRRALPPLRHLRSSSSSSSSRSAPLSSRFPFMLTVDVHCFCCLLAN